MVKKKELSPRKQKILQALVEDYIATAEPVSSGNLKKKYMNDISSATIRSELASLEDMGYLVQPHVSAGRVPSAKAYKHYVDNFVHNKPLTVKQKATINSYFEDKIFEMEDVVKQTAKILSDVTNYTSVIVINDITKVKIRNIKLVDIGDDKALVIIITDSGVLKDKTIDLPKDMKTSYLVNANNLINKIFANKTLNEIQDADELIDFELSDFKELVNDLVSVIESYYKDDKKIYLDGALKMLDYPEYNDIDSAKNFLSLINEKDKLCDVISNNDDIELSVKIGNDSGKGIDNCAIVTAKYMINGEEVGQAGVIGPERMDYNKVVSVLHYMANAMDEILANKKTIKKNLLKDNKNKKR